MVPTSYPPVLDRIHERIIERLSFSNSLSIEDVNWNTYGRLVLALEAVEKMRGRHV
jgi:hypothetical protein